MKSCLVEERTEEPDDCFTDKDAQVGVELDRWWQNGEDIEDILKDELDISICFNCHLNPTVKECEIYVIDGFAAGDEFGEESVLPAAFNMAEKMAGC